MLINDKSQLKQNVEQIGFQLALKTNESFGYCLACLQNTSMYNDETLYSSYSLPGPCDTDDIFKVISSKVAQKLL